MRKILELKFEKLQKKYDTTLQPVIQQVKF
jgi:hypothetical protein